MTKDKIFFHLVTNRKMEKGQIITFTGENKNTLFKFFFERNFVNETKQGVNEIVSKNLKKDGLNLNEKDSDIVTGYLDNSSRAIRETITEMVRLQEFPDYPSRLSCLYVARNHKDLLDWKKVFEGYNRKVLQIVKVKTDGNCFYGDGDNLPSIESISFNKKIQQARNYWSGCGEEVLPEVLIDGNIEVVEILEDFMNER